MGDNFVAAAAITAGAVFGALTLIKAFSKDENVRVISNTAECRRALNEIKK